MWYRYMVFVAILFSFTDQGVCGDLFSARGYGWHSNGFIPQLGDSLFIVASFSNVAPSLEVDLEREEVTVYACGLVATAIDTVLVKGKAYPIVTYDGGFMVLMVDPQQNAAITPNPPNASVPSSFVDGQLFLRCQFTYAQLFYDSLFEVGAMALTAVVLESGSTGMLEGSALPLYGTFERQFLPEGYDLDYSFSSWQPDLPVLQRSWGQIKALFKAR